MKLSLVVATNRNTFWARLCHSLAQNSAELEVIFVGPIGVGCEGLPVPVRFIDVPDPAIGAARCWEIGARAATGELLGFAPDDIVYTAGFLDAVKTAASGLHNGYSMFTARYTCSGSDQIANQRMWSVAEMPLLPVAGFTFAEDHHKIGGIDRRFHSVFWDTDLYMHMYQLGGRTTLLSDHVCEEHNSDHGLYGRNIAGDGEVLRALWPPPVTPTMQRASPRISWEDL